MTVLPTSLLQANLWATPAALSQALVEGAFRDRTGLGLELFRSGLEAGGVRDERLSGWIDEYQSDSSHFRSLSQSLSKIAGWMESHPAESALALQRIPRALFSPVDRVALGAGYFPENLPDREERAAAGVFATSHGNRTGSSRPRESLRLQDPEDEGKPETGMIRIDGIYRSILPVGEICPEIAVLQDKRGNFEDRLKALNAVGRILESLDAESDDFFRGVIALFRLATRPSGPRENRDRLRLESVRLLQQVLRRVPSEPARQEAFAHAYVKFKEAAFGALLRSSRESYGTPGRALAASTEQIGYSLARCKKHCSPAVQRYMEETGWELVQTGMWEDRGFEPPWTFRKGKRNAKIGFVAGAALFVSGAFWAALSLLISTPLAFWVFTIGALCLPAATLAGFLWRAPRRLRQKVVSLSLPSGRSQLKRLEAGPRRLLGPGKAGKIRVKTKV